MTGIPPQEMRIRAGNSLEPGVTGVAVVVVDDGDVSTLLILREAAAKEREEG